MKRSILTGVILLGGLLPLMGCVVPAAEPVAVAPVPVIAPAVVVGPPAVVIGGGGYWRVVHGRRVWVRRGPARGVARRRWHR
jgi:hypothetical protein